MPHIITQTSSGRTNWHYDISTPSQANATEIQPNIPTILFLHAAFINKELFQLQWADPRVRRFNCVAFDLMGHGQTESEGPPPKTYNQEMFLEDIVSVMNALNLPACHIVGVSMGTIGAIPLAIRHPELVLSLFLISPLGLEEPRGVAEGREEIHLCWKQGYFDPSWLEDSIYGGHQLAFSNVLDSLATALLVRGVPLAMKSWGPPFELVEAVTVTIFTERKPYTQEELAKIKCPVKLVHCLNDIPYPLDYSQRFCDLLLKAGVNVSLETVPDAPHFGCAVTAGAEAINPMLHDFVFANSTGDVPPAPASVTSPWDEGLLEAGWLHESDDDNSGDNLSL